MTDLGRLVFSFFNLEVMRRYLPAVAEGFVLTVWLALLVIGTGLLLGLALAVVRSAGVRPVNWLIVACVDVLRALPPLVIIVLFYFALPYVGVRMSGLTATWLSLSLVLGAFAEEIFWAGILSVHRGQWEAARSTGLTFGQTLAWVVLPQAVRLTIPSLTNRAIAITKGTALGSVVGVPEILTPHPGRHGPVLRRQPIAAHAGRRRLPGPLRPLRGPGPLGGDPLRVEALGALLQNFFNPAIMRAAAPLLLKGLATTAVLCLVVVPVGVLGGLGVALLSTVRSRWVAWPLVVYVDFFRAFPPLVLLIFVYFGLPFLGLDLPAFVAVALTFLLNTSSYYGEILRAGIESVGRGQTEAARSTGLTRLQALAWVVLPQAVRNVLPDLVSNTLEVVKLTSLASVVALPELLYAARSAQSLTYNPSPIVLAAAMYAVLLWPGVRLLSRLEHRMLVAR